VVQIDGGQGEGGGQVLRTALALSAVRGVPVRVGAIRARRKSPGLQAQHLTAVRALADICQAHLEGAALGSRELTFAPRAIRPGDYRFEVGTAGSITLVLQAILLPLALADGPSRVTLCGGTHVPWSPPAEFCRDVFLPALASMGVHARLQVVRPGFYPRGGGEVVVEIPGGAELAPLALIRRGRTERVRGISAVAGLPRTVAERQRSRVLARLEEAGLSAEIEVAELRALDPGSFLFLVAESEGGAAGFSALGARGKPAEEVAEEVVAELLAFLRADAGCDPHLADQLLGAMALAPGTSRLTTTRVTSHLRTTLEVARQILGCPVQLCGEEGEPGTVTMQGGAPRNARRASTVERGATSDEAQQSSVPDAPRSTLHAPPAGHPLGGHAPRARKARAGDGPAIQQILAHFAAKGELLPRTLNEVYQHLRDFFVCEAGAEVAGVCALSLYWEDLAEVRSLAVLETHGGRGLGSALVTACVEEAAALGIRRVFALTYRQPFFERLGFRVIQKEELPQKIWKDCIHCAKFTCCDEIALIRDTQMGNDQ